MDLFALHQPEPPVTGADGRALAPPAAGDPTATWLTHPDLLQARWERAAEALVLSDAQGIVLAANAAYLRLVGFCCRRRGRSQLRQQLPARAARLGASSQYQHLFADPASVPVYQSVVQRADGVERVVELQIAFVHTDGQRVAMLSTLRDITDRTRADAQVQLQARMLDQVHDAVIAIDAQQCITYFNPAAERQYGISAAAALGQPLGAVYAYGWLRPGDEAAATEALARTGVWRGKNLHVRRDGTTLHVELVVSVLPAAAGVPPGLLAVIRDITDRTRAEAAVHASEERLRLLIESAQDYAIFSLDPQWRVTSWSTGAAVLFGYTEREVLGHSGDVVFTPEDRAQGAPAREAATARDAGQAADERWHLRKDGTRFYGSGTLRPLRGADATLRGFVKILRDLTERQRAEAALRASEERLRVLVESVQDYAIFTVDPAGRVMSWNEGARRLKGYLADEIVGQPMERFYLPEDVAAGKPAQERQTALVAGRSEDESWRVRKDGTRLWINEIMTALIADDGTHLGFTKISRDLTARKAAEDAVARALAVEQAARAEAEAALATRAQFLSIASHELRTPLTSLIGFAYLLPRATAQGPAALTALSERITHQARRLDTLVGQLLDVARLQQGSFVLDRQVLDLTTLVAQVVERFGVALSADSAHAIIWERPDGPVVLEADGAPGAGAAQSALQRRQIQPTGEPDHGHAGRAGCRGDDDGGRSRDRHPGCGAGATGRAVLSGRQRARAEQRLRHRVVRGAADRGAPWRPPPYRQHRRPGHDRARCAAAGRLRAVTPPRSWYGWARGAQRATRGGAWTTHRPTDRAFW